ncbi:hypothetical protein COLO4_33206 [Corchorus olitorius]|uniref:Uncharacterized protein n=1 Tax=Corchorus olitorius TaxID=93759 RepID=A0A1R3GVM3_9ROSI|nr:hypothetical protein COLO4_33206 [Corchorus olitorius]
MEAEAKALLQVILLANQFGITLNYIEKDSLAFTNAMQSQVSLALLGRFTIKRETRGVERNGKIRRALQPRLRANKRNAVLERRAKPA